MIIRCFFVGGGGLRGACDTRWEQKMTNINVPRTQLVLWGCVFGCSVAFRDNLPTVCTLCPVFGRFAVLQFFFWPSGNIYACMRQKVHTSAPQLPSQVSLDLLCMNKFLFVCCYLASCRCVSVCAHRTRIPLHQKNPTQAFSDTWVCLKHATLCVPFFGLLGVFLCAESAYLCTRNANKGVFVYLVWVYFECTTPSFGHTRCVSVVVC